MFTTLQNKAIDGADLSYRAILLKTTELKLGNVTCRPTMSRTPQ